MLTGRLIRLAIKSQTIGLTLNPLQPLSARPINRQSKRVAIGVSL